MFGQLSGVSLPDGRVISYDRDALNRVTAKRVNGAVTQGWIYKDGLKPVAETDAAGSIVSLFVYGTSALSPAYMVKDGTTYRLIRDFAGSVRLVVNADSGAVAQRLDYDSFGRVVAAELMNSGTNELTNFSFQPFGFKSGLYDSDTGLVHFGARWYDSEIGRWISKDPILLEGGLNLYAFCGNDPVNFSDPLGLCEKTVLDGSKVQQDQLNFLMWPPGNQYNPFHIMETFFNLNPDPNNHFDLKEKPNADSVVYSYNGQLNPPDFQGNINVGYVSFRAYGPLGCAIICIGGEAAYPTTRDAMVGSFRANWQGAVDAAEHATDQFVIWAAVNAVVNSILP